MLPNELVELAMRLNPIKPLLAFLYVTIDAEVSRLALHVLGVVDTSNGPVQC